MSLWQRWYRWAHRENELDEEIQAHLRMAERDRTERGETAEDARAQVRREFGNVLLTKEVTREPSLHDCTSRIGNESAQGSDLIFNTLSPTVRHKILPFYLSQP